MAITRHSVEISIDELVIEGCAPADRYRVGAALEAELTRLLKGDALSVHYNRGQHIPVIHFSILPAVQSEQSAEALGANIAASIFTALRQQDALLRQAS